VAEAEAEAEAEADAEEEVAPVVMTCSSGEDADTG